MRRSSLALFSILVLALVITRPAAAHGPLDPAAGQPAETAAEDTAEQEAQAAEPAEEGEAEEDEDEDKDEKWDVDNPPGEADEVPIDVDEGTWMSVDVSPDGRHVVFDLLGDLYEMPIEGGEARALTEGLAWDMEPRYSPDGARIAFTSDRGGGFNIWVMERDGGEPEAVSNESYRTLNSPVWTPDGEFIAGRKHFTSRRSLGAGEIWLYHRSGSKGLQMTEKPNEQKDLGEPAFSPDGRYLYYSQDVTPGTRFEYNKDSNGEIYAIQRLDRESGEVDRFAGGPGGAITPTPSPDGEHLAFIRRVRGKSVLHLQEIASGAERPIYDELERDMQEAWAIFGVYPHFAWTPDSRSLVFWAGGKIRRLEVASGDVSVIPFRVQATRTVLDTLRFPRRVAPPRFDVKMLRWVEVSPAGDRVVYQALGHIWVRTLPDGEPRRLTRQSDHFEFYPSFSRDGREIVYTTWSDDELGSVRVMPAAGGTGRRLTERPGHYVEPAFSPDGTTIVFRKTGGGFITSPHWSRDPGLYRVPAGGGEAVRFTRGGFEPGFGAASDRVYYIQSLPKDRRALKSIELDGSDERTHAESAAATEFALSPDGRWLAFRERFQAYVTPFVATGKTIQLGPQTSSLPVTRVSSDAGEYLHFSGDSGTLYWSMGPELFERDLAQAFAFLPGAPEELPEPPAEGLGIGFTAETDVPTGTTAFVGARVLTMRDDEVLDNATVVVEGNRIAAVGPADEVAVPAGAHRVDAAGMTLMPGIIDVHAHGPQSSSGLTPQRNWLHYATLAFGVTTVHDPSNDTASIFAASELAQAGMLTAPRIYSTGTILYGADGDFKAEIDSLEDARKHLKRMKAAGAFSVKSYNQPRRDQRQQVVTAARELEMLVVTEGGSLLENNLTMVVDGTTGIEHNLPVANIYDDVRQLWRGSDCTYTPTLVVSYGGLSGELYWYQHTDVWANERLLSFVPRRFVDSRSRRRQMAPEEEYNHIAAARVVEQLADEGVLTPIGAHGQREGLAAHWEIWMFVQGGMTPHEALRSATIVGAEHLGMEADLGTVETGKLADLIVLDADPLADIKNSESIRYTMVNGRLYDARTMDQIGNHPQQRGQLYWEE